MQLELHNCRRFPRILLAGCAEGSNLALRSR